MRYLLGLVFLFLTIGPKAQCISYTLSSRGDTLNCMDTKGLKQGKWIVPIPKLRGEPPYEEEGIFVDSKKEGQWRRFNLMGDLLAQENYKWGLKNGRCLYFSLRGLEREESWRAINPNKGFDTLEVMDPKDQNKFTRVIVKNEGGSIPHGTWKDYSSITGALTETRQYRMGELLSPEEEALSKTATAPTGATAAAQPLAKDSLGKASPPKKVVPKEVAEFEKKNAGKKNVKVVDGRVRQ